MTPLISEIKRTTQYLRCPEHNEAPEVNAYGEKIEFKCCCEAFKGKLLAISKKTFEEHAEKTIKDMLKDAFKGSKHIKIR